MVWRVGLQPASAADDEAEEPHWLHILVMLEFQSRSDWMMAARVQSYATLLYLALHREKPFSASNPVPPVLPIVLYNGSSPWHAPLNLSALTRPGGMEAASAEVSAQAEGETGKPGALGAHVGPMGLVGDGYVLVDQQALLGEELPEGNAATLLAWVEGLTSPEDLKRVALFAVAFRGGRWQSFGCAAALAGGMGSKCGYRGRGGVAYETGQAEGIDRRGGATTG